MHIPSHTPSHTRPPYPRTPRVRHSPLRTSVVALFIAVLCGCAAPPISPPTAPAITQSAPPTTAAPPAAQPAAAIPPGEAPKPAQDPALTVYFSLGSVAISPAAQPVIRALAERLKDNRYLYALLTGHTDDLGSREYCVALSQKRATAVEAALLKLGVRPSQIRKAARGNELVADTNCSTEACRRLMRRVDIRLVESRGP